MAENTNKFDITSTVAEKGIDAAKGFLSKLIGPAVEETGLLLADRVRYFRFKNQVELLQKAEAHVKKKNIKVKEIPVKTIAPLLEGASLEEDEELKQMWVGLLVNYVDSEKNFTSSVFPHILGQVSSREAQFLKIYSEQSKKSPGAPMKLHIKTLPPEKRISNAELGNLLRLGLIEDSMNRLTGVFLGSGNKSELSDWTFDLTSLGNEFMQACELENKDSDSSSTPDQPGAGTGQGKN